MSIKQQAIPVEEIRVIREVKQTVVSCDADGCDAVHVKSSEGNPNYAYQRDLPSTWWSVHGGDCWAQKQWVQHYCSRRCLMAGTAAPRWNYLPMDRVTDDRGV